MVYEDGDKRYNDEIFHFDGHNGAIVLENGGGKTVFIHTVLQAIFPHTNLGNRKIKETLQLENAPAHIGIEWIKNENPRRYVTTCVSIYLTKDGIDSFRYVFEYDADNPDRLEEIPFVRETINGKRPADRGEIMEYYTSMKSKSMYAHHFSTIRDFRTFIEEHYHIIAKEWESIVHINGDEGGIDKFFENCRTTNDLYDRLLIPTVEASIQGHESGMFAEMFEKQREGFHMYKKLNESMRENELIQAELEKYVTIFENYTEKEEAYEKDKSYTKGLWIALNHQKIETEQAQEENRERLEAWEENKEDYQWKKTSFNIYLEEQKKEELEDAHTERVVSYDEAKDRLNALESEYVHLQYAELKTDLHSKEEQLKQLITEHERKERDEDVIDIEEQLEATNRALKGFFVDNQERLNKIIENKKFERAPLENKRSEFLKQEEGLEKKLRDTEVLIGKLGEKINIHNESRKKIKQEILGNPEQENVQDEKEKWEKRSLELDEWIIELGQREKKIIHTLDKVAEEKTNLLKEKHTDELKVSQLEEEQKRLETAHDELIQALGTIKPKWNGLTDLYMREHTVTEELADLTLKLEREQEAFLQQERMARRLLDDYEDQEMFFGDVFLNQQLSSWKNQLDYLVSGVEFFRSLNEEQQRNYKSYPLWPVTLITTNQSKPVLLERLTRVQDRLQMPIQVLTSAEVQSLDEKHSTEWVNPGFWQNNLDQEKFLEWKEELAEQADIIIAERKEKEAEITRLTLVKEQFQQFFAAYPKENREQLIEEIEKTTATLRRIDRLMEEKEKVETSLKEEQQSLQENIETYRSEMNGLAVRLSKAQEYLMLEKEIEKSHREFEEAREKEKQITNESRVVKRQITRFSEDIEHVTEEIRDAQNELTFIERDENYQTVKEVQAQFTGEDKVVILDRLRSLEYEIRKIEKSYNEVQTNITYTKRDIERISSEMVQLKEENEITIDEAFVFPPNGPSLMRMLQERIKYEKKATRQANKAMLQAKSDLDRQDGVVQTEMKAFTTRFPDREMYQFEDAIGEIKRNLAREQEKLAEREAYLNQEKNRIHKETMTIQEAISQLDRFQEAHHFNSTQIEGKSFSENEITELTYERVKTAKEATERLRSGKLLVLDAREEVDQAKRRFRLFCERTIQDVKLKRMAIEGIEQKESYEDILQFRKNMTEGLEQANKYARDYISKNDKDLQAFIDRIHHHLRTVIEQLLLIPKKTRVNVEGNWKEIFKFTIPEWTEEEGKERIREHIHWVLEQLESGRFVNEEGIEDRTKVRQAIEDWLETKQLLQMVIHHEKMKVNCRKVTNDNNVTKRFHTWEESNKWSGGEKWSKNMTLFLGILNFVAEKKQHVQTGKKRNRAVILDNPFGRASSEHVLSPVFFIAEQLGFQIIALTAHAEGKYLQDYFPVLYSCKLRSSSDPRKKVMTKEKTLHLAYFQDHDPDALDRLGEIEQMELF